jgi:hypothetical protein
VTIGEIKILSVCTKVAPVTSFKTLPEKLFDGFVKEEIFTETILDEWKSLKLSG